MNNLIIIDQLYGSPNPQTLKGKILNINPDYYIVGGILIVLLIVGVSSISFNRFEKKYGKVSKKDTD